MKLNFEISSIFFDIFFWGSLKLSQTFQRFYTAGEWLFVEVDRSQDVEENSEEFEVSLYPLNLGSTYNILDQQYRTFATVNLHLGTELTECPDCSGHGVVSVDYSEGGHYTVNVLVSEDEVISVHEDSIQRRPLPPTFDHGVILVLLRKLHNNSRQDDGGPESQGVFTIKTCLDVYSVSFIYF